MQVIRRIINKAEFGQFDIPDNFAEKAEIIILPYDDQQKPDIFSEDEDIYAIRNNMRIADGIQEGISIPTQEITIDQKDSDSEFKIIGLTSFFDNSNDNNINWEAYFELK